MAGPGLVCVLVSALVAAVGNWTGYVQARQALRERILAAMRTEFAALPLYPDGGQTHYLATAEAGGGPLISAEYHVTGGGSCAGMQTFYASAAPGAGWETSEAPHILSGSDEMDSTYRKVADGYKLELHIACRIGTLGYDLSLWGGENVPAGIGFSPGRSARAPVPPAAMGAPPSGLPSSHATQHARHTMR